MHASTLFQQISLTSRFLPFQPEEMMELEELERFAKHFKLRRVELGELGYNLITSTINSCVCKDAEFTAWYFA